MNNKIEIIPVGGQVKGKNNEMKRLPLFAVLALFVLAMVFVATYLVVREYNHETSTALERREAIANLGALLIHEKFDGIIDVGISLASRARVYNNIEERDWDEAIENLKEILQTFPYLDNVLLFDKEGVLKASVVPSPEMIGKSFAHRDYYQGVSKDWEPYVSEAFKRAVEPKDNVVSVAVPILSSDQRIIGILVLAVKLDAITDWLKEVDVGSGGIIFVVDKKGQLVAHPQLRAVDNLADYFSVSSVQYSHNNDFGTEIHNKDFAVSEEHIASWAHVRDYGFVIEIAQPTRIAFAERKNKLIEYLLFWTLIIISATVFLYRVLKDRVMLRAQRDHEATLLESIGDGVVAIDRGWSITLWNKSASAITGWSKEEAMGKPLRTVLKFLRERDRVENIVFIEDAMVRGKVTTMSDSTILVRKDGSETQVGDSAAPIFCGGGETPDGAIIVFRDMSLALEKSHLRSDIAYATHQFRTPVTEALWNLEMAIDEQDTDKRKEDIRIAYQAILSIKKLSEHLVFVSEIDQGDIAVKLSAVKFVNALTDVQKKIEKEAKLRDITLSIATVSPLLAINTDKKLLSRALFEIIENAVIYSPRGSKVEVMTTIKEKEILIEVVDTGVGITEEEQPIIFTKFFRGSNRGKMNAGGGLGLYLAKAYISLLGGKIWFTSEKGKGTTFSVTIPIA